jgi:hypothetical protein
MRSYMVMPHWSASGMHTIGSFAALVASAATFLFIQAAQQDKTPLSACDFFFVARLPLNVVASLYAFGVFWNLFWSSTLRRTTHALRVSKFIESDVPLLLGHQEPDVASTKAGAK